MTYKYSRMGGGSESLIRPGCGGGGCTFSGNSLYRKKSSETGFLSIELNQSEIIERLKLKRRIIKDMNESIDDLKNLLRQFENEHDELIQKLGDNNG